ncbi:unnamed protein product [Lepidochelys kempii]
MYSTVNMKATEASYCVALRIAKSGKPHNAGEKLLIPAAKDTHVVMRAEKAALKRDVIPLSNDTVSHPIVEMATGVKDQVLESVRNSPYYSMQTDESTNIPNAAQLLVYIHFAAGIQLKEEFLFCNPLVKSFLNY